jgi:hypothetical protein
MRPSPAQRAPDREASFGRRGVKFDLTTVAADDVWRAVAALHKLSPEQRNAPEMRAACLYYALRLFHAPERLDAAVDAVSARLAAFEHLLASEPDLLDGERVDAALEDAIYEAVAVTPLMILGEHRRFDPKMFKTRLPELLDRQLNARARMERLRAAERPRIFLSALH